MNVTKLLCAAALPAIMALAATLNPAFCAEYSTPQLRLPLMQNAPTIDGAIHEDEWEGADRMERFGSGAALAAQQASFWIGSDGKELFVAVRSETPPGGQLLTRANPQAGDGDAPTFTDDSVELYVAPQPDAADAKVYQAIFNARGAIYDTLTTPQGAVPWRGRWRVKSSVSDNRWDCEIAIPWSEFGVDGSIPGRSIALRVGRNWQRSADVAQSEWSPLGGAYNIVSTMARVQWDNSAPVVQVLQLQDAPNSPANIRLRLSNPTAAALRVLATVDMAPQNSATTHSAQTVELPAGGSREIIASSPALGAEPIATHIAVTSPDGQAIYYRRDFSWQIARPATLWNLPSEVARAFVTQYAYFPSPHAMHVRVDLNRLPQREQARGITLAVRRKGSTQLLAQTAMPPLQNGVSELRRWDLPDLGEGEYELVVTPDGVQTPPEVLPFVRHKFEWEGNALGKSDVVVAPFTPIVVKGNQVETVLRRHSMNGLGLWDQVVADGQSLLKAPMRLEANIGGRVLPAQGTLKITGSSATHATAQATWSAGALHGSTQSVWDDDGVMRSTLTLQPTTQNVESLTLVIPLDNAQMPLLHTATDGIRLNDAGSTPAGSGRVWDSTKAKHRNIIGNYVPYIWLGGAERGLSVFGENDKGWMVDDKTPCQEIVRNANGTLELRLNLIQQPSPIIATRQITLGFQATPVKPMPENWRLWTVGKRGAAKAPGQFHERFLGADYYWGSVTASDDIYPRKQDFSLWDKFAETRKSGKIDRDFLQQWLADYNIPDTPAWQKKKATYRAHIESGFYEMSTQPQSVVAYTNPRGMRLDTPEGRTFLDEWHRGAFPSREYSFGDSDSYGVDPVASYRDFQAFYWQKMLTTFVDSLYWDNTFLSSSFNPITTAAYVRADGQVQPSSGLWNMRDVVHRGAVLAQELGKPNHNMVHMTNAAIAPIIGRARTQLSWEYSYGDIDFQDRFKRDYIQAISIGRQFGNVPFVLTLIAGTDKDKVAWAQRTAAGVMLTHELKPSPAEVPVADYWQNYDRLVEFGYGQPSVKVWNYWQSDFPAKISGESSSLLLSKPGSTLLVVCDWGEGGNFKADLDAKALDLTGKLTATDAESGAALPVSDSGSLTFPLKKHDFKVVHITTN